MRYISFLSLLALLASANICLAQGGWQTAPSIITGPRYNCTANTIGNKIYLAAGDSLYKPTNKFEVFDPLTSAWSIPQTTGTFDPRSTHGSAVVDGKLYIIGTAGTVDVGSVQVFDPATNHWSTPETHGTFSPRLFLAAAAVDGKIYAIGGDTGDFVPSPIVEVYDPVTSTWSTPQTTGDFTPRSGLTACALGGKIYVIGGGDEHTHYYDLQVFDPAANTWSTPTTTGMFTPRAVLTSCVVDGKIYAIGGMNRSGVLSTMEVFDPATNTWTTPVTDGHMTARGWLASAVVNTEAGPSIYVIGGDTNGQMLDTVESYSPLLNSVRPSVSSTEMVLSPNPTSGRLDIRSNDESITRLEVVNLLGQRVLEEGKQGGTTSSIDLTNCAAGVYSVIVETTNGIATQRIVKQ